jgi:hypothetical protein
MRLTGQRSLCRSCGLLFRSTAAFDKHRTGSLAKGERRCLTETEMLAKGMAINYQGLWVSALMKPEEA